MFVLILYLKRITKYLIIVDFKWLMISLDFKWHEKQFTETLNFNKKLINIFFSSHDSCLINMNSNESYTSIICSKTFFWEIYIKYGQTERYVFNRKI